MTALKLASSISCAHSPINLSMVTELATVWRWYCANETTASSNIHCPCKQPKQQRNRPAYGMVTRPADLAKIAPTSYKTSRKPDHGQGESLDEFLEATYNIQYILSSSNHLSTADIGYAWRPTKTTPLA